MSNSVPERIGWIVVATALLWAAVQVAGAQDIPATDFPPAPDPSECVVAPVSEAALRQLPAGIPATPLARPAEPASALALFPNSGSVPAATRQEIEALVHQLIACYNAGDWRRAAALFTHSYLERIVAASGDQVMEYFPPEPEPLDSLDWDSAYVGDVRQAGSGRLVAMVHRCEGDVILYFRQEDGEWRIDDSIDVYDEGFKICGVVPLPTRTPVP